MKKLRPYLVLVHQKIKINEKNAESQKLLAKVIVKL